MRLLKAAAHSRVLYTLQRSRPFSGGLEQSLMREESIRDKNNETAGHESDVQLDVTRGIAIMHVHSAVASPRALAARLALCASGGGRVIFRPPCTETCKFVCVFVLQYNRHSSQRIQMEEDAQ